MSERETRPRPLAETIWDVDGEIKRIATTAAAVCADNAEVRRWAVRAMQDCATLARPPPRELIGLIKRLLGVDRPRRKGQIKNRAKFIAAVHYVATRPEATPAQIARAIDYDQKRLIKSWLVRDDFKKAVSHYQGVVKSRFATPEG